jgi:hypothetical protein
MTDREKELSAALLWLRNHYEIGDSRLKLKVLDRIDRVLADGPPITGAMSAALREKYPHGG